MSINQLSVFVENRPGKLVECMQVMKKAGVDIRALSIADTQDFGILRLIVKDTETAKNALREEGFIVKVNQVVGVAMDDHSGALCDVVKMLSDNGVNIEYMYAFITRDDKYAYVVLRVEDNDACISLLEKNGVKLVSEEDINK